MQVLKCALVLSGFLFTVAPTARAQRLVDGCDRMNDQYVTCDHTMAFCECREQDLRDTDTCYFCLEIEQRPTFTRYNLTEDEIQIQRFGGRVWYFNSAGDFEEYPPSNVMCLEK